VQQEIEVEEEDAAELAAPAEGEEDDFEPKKSEQPVTKKSKSSTASAPAATAMAGKSKEASSWELGNKRKVTVEAFKGRVYVGIREFYEKDGELLPGKKGINLTPEQFESLLTYSEEILEAAKNFKGDKKK